MVKSAFIGGALAFSLLSTSALAANLHPETGEKLADEQVFTYRILDEHSSLDPQIVEDVTGSELMRDLFEGLYNQDNDGNLEPGVATHHDLSEDKTVYTFHLRPEARWSDGKPVTAHDFVFAWQRAADPKTASPYAWFVELMSLKNAKKIVAGDMSPSDLGVKALDDHRFEVTLSAPLPYFPLMTTHATTFPSPQWAIEAHGDAWTKPENMVSNGAYVLAEHVPSERSVRVRNANYWNNEETIIEKVVTLVINDENAALTRYLAGELDRTEIPSGQYPSYKKSHPEEAVSFPRLCSYYYWFNHSDSGPEAFNDKRVRQALSFALDRNVITDRIMQGGQFPAYTFTPAVTAGFEVPEVPFGQMSQKERDAKAKDLLAEAGYGAENPLEFTIVYNTSEGHKKIAIAASQMWKQKLGAKVTLENLEWKTFLTRKRAQQFDVSRNGWCGDYNEASTFLDLMHSQSSYNDGKYVNEEVDKLLSEAKTAENPQANYTRIEEIIADEMPIIPIYHYTNVYMLRANLKNWPINNAEQNWYSRNLYKTAE
ncbi:peptide ABC transporter substrate-binding protein [Polycladidibacter hongkongensis]|uniref:peptide ABC transporter substrate-binding protein n=1 Tax=Polycladidibacter hongkongensis TaxID=1647556 RepID=UPI00083699E9|nr:peptide ABC transporter substrate-binding protein [Pseudovibrio hongkongensis]